MVRIAAFRCSCSLSTINDLNRLLRAGFELYPDYKLDSLSFNLLGAGWVNLISNSDSPPTTRQLPSLAQSILE